MANTLNLGDGNWGVKDSSLLGYAKDNTKFVPETFDVTRASSGTRVNKAGLIETVTEVLSEELITNGDFSNGSTDWTIESNWTIAGGVANGNGANGTSQELTQGGLTSGKTYSITYEIKNYVSGVVKTRKPAGTFRSGNGVYAENLTASASGLTFQGGNFNGSITNISAIEINQENLARIDYTDSVEGVLLTEPQSTNLINKSELLNIYFDSKADTTITDSYGTSPSGETNSSRIQFADETSFCYTSVSISTSHTSSVFVKGISGETIRFGIGSSVVTGALFTFNGLWQRIEYTTSSATQIFFSSYSGPTARDFEAFGLQLEALPYATSYIPTYGQIASRAADLVTNGGDVNNFNSEEGVLFVEMAALINGGSGRWISISDGTGTNRVSIAYESSSTIIRVYVRNSGGVVFDYELSGQTQINFNKVAVKWKINDFALWVNGVEVASESSGTTYTENTLNSLQLTNGSVGSPFYGKTKNVQAFNEALTDEELYNLTSDRYATYDTMATDLTFDKQ